MGKPHLKALKWLPSSMPIDWVFTNHSAIHPVQSSVDNFRTASFKSAKDHMDVSTERLEQCILDTGKKLKYFVNIWRIIRGSNTMLNTNIKTSSQLCSTWRECKYMELLCYLRPWADEFQIVSENSPVQCQDINLSSRARKFKSCNMTVTYNMGIIGTYSDRCPVFYNGQEKVLT